HLAYLRHTANFPAGVALLEQHLPLALRTSSCNDRCRFFLATAVFLRSLAEARPRCRLRLPHQFPLYTEDGRYDLEVVAAWFEKRVTELGARFNRRNGNADYTTQAHEELDY